MALTKEDVVNIAHLARLAIDAKDIPEYEKNLSNILALVEQMSQVDTTQVEPMAHPLDAVHIANNPIINTNQHNKQSTDIACTIKP